MNYYVINADDDGIVEVYSSRPSQEQLQREANAFDCPVYVIEGQHAGMTAEPEPREDKHGATAMSPGGWLSPIKIEVD